jgi:signal transduction histidine kinase
MSPHSLFDPGDEAGAHEAVLRGLALALAQGQDLAASLTQALAGLEERLGLTPSRVYALRRGGVLRLVASHGLEPGQVAELSRVELGQGFTGLAAQRRRTVVMPVEHLDDHRRRAMLGALGMRAVCAVPLVLHREMVGVLNVATRQRVGFTPREQGFLDIMAGLLAAAVAAHLRGERLEAARQDLGTLEREIDLKVAEQIGDLREQMEGMTQGNRRLQQTWNLVMQAERTAAVARFTSALAHELRNPFMVIGGFAHRLDKSLEPGDPRANYVKVIMDQVQRLELMLEEVFKLNREKDLDLTEVDPGSALREALEKAVLLAGKPAQEPVWELPLDLPRPITDRGLLVKALAALIQNALEATRDKGGLHLGAVMGEQGQVVFSVGDSGPGLAAQEYKHIFDPLYTTKEFGVGLGMPLCREVVILLGGELTAGERSGGGARFQIKLPMHPPAAHAPAPPKE